MALTHQKFGKSQADNGGVERCRLCGCSPFIGCLMVFVCSVAKGKTRLQFGMKNDGVFGVTQGLKALHK